MAYEPASDLAAVQALYIAYFGRAGEPGGVDYWVDRMSGPNAMSFAEVAASFSAQPEARAEHPFLANPNSDPAVFVQSLYTQLLNRPDAQTADPTGFNYWLDKIDDAAGKPLELGLLIAQFISGAQGADIATIENKVEGAIYFTQELEAAGITGVDANGQVTAVIKEIASAVVDGITSNPASIIESREETDAYVEDGTIPDPSGGGGNPGGNPGGGGGNPGGGGGAGIAYDAGVLSLTAAHEYSITSSTTGGGFEVRIDGVVRAIYSATDLAALTEIHVRNNSGELDVAGSFLNDRTLEFSGAGSVNVTGVTIPESTDTTPVEANVDLDGIDFANTGAQLVNGSVAAFIQARWDVLDDRYGNADYYNVDINADFVELGLQYVAYLESDGEPFTEFTAKGLGTRDQSMHDNLLGNLYRVEIESRFSGAQESDFLARIPEEYLDRPVFSGNAGDVNGANHDAVRAFDYEKGWARPDYIQFTANGTGDARAIEDSTGNLFVGSNQGIPAVSLATVENAGAGIELSFNIRHYASTAYTADTAVYNGSNGANFSFTVQDGLAPGRTDRAEWTFNPIVVAGTNDQPEDLSNFRFELDIDLDPGEGTHLLQLVLQTGGTYGQGRWVVAADSELGQAGTVIFPDNEGDAFTSQNSHNFAFDVYQQLFDVDPGTPGNQPYALGAGTFEFELRAFDGVNLVGVNHTTVVVA